MARQCCKWKCCERQVTYGIVVIGIIAGICKICGGEHRRGSIPEFSCNAILQLLIKAAESKKPVEGQRPSCIVEPRPRCLSTGRDSFGSHFCDRPFSKLFLSCKLPG